jgi:SAM-dependent methyltransferase
MSKDFWEENAAAWAKVIHDNTIASRAITNEAIIKLLSEKNFLSVIDIGCGEGWLCTKVPASMEYLGIDGSANLIEIAKDKYKSKFQHVLYSEITAGKWNPGKKYAAAVFNFSLLDENITELLKNTRKFSDTLIIQTLHPCFALAKYQDAWNSEDFKTMAVPFSGNMPWYGRTLSSWVKLFTDCGLALQEIREPQAGDKPSSLIFILK